MPDHPNDPAYDPPPQCEHDGCDSEDVTDDPMFNWLCGDHMSEAYTSYHAELAYDIAKEDATWEDMRGVQRDT